MIDEPYQALTKLQKIAQELLLGEYHKHVFLCVGDACCNEKTGEAAWTALKKELKDRQLSLASGPHACYRSKVGCLRVCTQGPIMVVYPEGTWYFEMTADKISRFVEEHLVQNRPIEEWIFARNPLSGDARA